MIRFKLVEQPAKLRAVGLGSARHFAEHLLASGLGQLAHLSVNALAVGGYPRVAVFHASLMAITYAKEKPFQINGLIFFHNSQFLQRSATCGRWRLRRGSVFGSLSARRTARRWQDGSVKCGMGQDGLYKHS